MAMFQRGQRSPAIAEVQRRLELIGFSIDAVESDGFFGPSTEAAVRGFQQQSGLDVDGIAGDATLRRLAERSWKLGDRPLRLSDPAMRGADVLDLQSRLNALGFSAGKQDGIFGAATAGAVVDFQRNLAIDEDGIAGAETVRALERLRLVTRKGLGPRIRERESRMAGTSGITGKRIAIDAGHGGDDPGASGPSGETEAELAFRLAALLAEQLEGMGAETTLTRGPNDDPDESDRAFVANSFGADLLISVHLNSHHLEEASGSAAYFFEGAEIASEPGEHLAQLLQEACVRIGRKDCRTHGKSYPLLRETWMPAVLIEPCFVTNPEEAKLIGDEAGAEALAKALSEAVSAYFSSSA